MIAAAVAVAFAGGALGANVTLRASHQFPGGKGDVRDEMVQMIARDAKGGQRGAGSPGLSRARPSSRRTSSGTRS
jgi:hypothetical protein